MADLTTYTQVEAELAATAGYDATNDTTLAKRRVAALRRKMDFAEASDENGRKIQFNFSVVESQLATALEWIKRAEFDSMAESAKISDPNVLHADFSNFGRYA
jgi:hypothetical protein